MTSPATAHTLSEVREHIDALDRQIIALIAARQQWVTRAGQALAR